MVKYVSNDVYEYYNYNNEKVNLSKDDMYNIVESVLRDKEMYFDIFMDREIFLCKRY